MIKKIIKSTTFSHFLGWVISIYLKICYHTSSWIVKENQNIDKLMKTNKSFIVCFWHGRLLMTPYCWNYNKKFFMLISGHRDGQIISQAVSYFGIKTITGSSSKNKIASFKSIINEVHNDNIIGITPDGPRGPNRKIKDGLISLAKLTKIPIIPLSFSAKYKKSFNSWDKFLFIFPFNKFVAIWGRPIYFDKGKTTNVNKIKLEKELNRITNLADNLLL